MNKKDIPIKEFDTVDFSSRTIRLDLYLLLLRNNGYATQLDKLREESVELTEATNNFINIPSKENRQALFSEMIDVTNMIEQVMCMLGATEAEINNERNFKLSRTKHRYNL